MKRFDLHNHTNSSKDSLSPITWVIERARVKGLDGIAITDHDTAHGVLSYLEKNGQPEGLLLVPGAEIKTIQGFEILGYFLNQEIISKDALEVLDEIRDQGGVSSLPHPRRTNYIFPRGNSLPDYPEEVMRMVDAVECINGRTRSVENRAAADLANKWKKPGTAGSDSHFMAEIGAGWLEFGGAVNSDNGAKGSNDIDNLEQLRISMLKGHGRPVAGKRFMSNSHYFFATAAIKRLLKLNPDLRSGFCKDEFCRYYQAQGRDGNSSKEDKDRYKTTIPIEGIVGKASGKRRESIGKTSEKILQAIEKDDTITIPELATLIGVTERSIERNIQKLQSNGLLKRMGGRKEGRWEVRT